MLQLEQAIDSFSTLQGRLPGSLDELVGDDSPWGDRPIPADPWGSAYVYRPKAGGDYVLMSLGADGVVGGEDDEADIDRAALRVNDSRDG